MLAVNSFFRKLINGSVQFLIPVFQRDYTWGEEECTQLWCDVLDAAKHTSDQGHFMGSVVYIAAEESMATFNRWIVIDGQQRLTSLTLLLAALRNYIADTHWLGTGNDSPTVERINQYFLLNPLESGDRHRKLVLRRADDDTLGALVSGANKPERPSQRILDAYALFRGLVEKIDPDTIYRGVNKLVVVDVTLQRGTDNPQLVFESLNTTGVRLSQADLIRNFVLMGLPEGEQTNLYDKYWSSIESSFRDSQERLDSFARDYVAQKTKVTKQTRGDRIYAEFKMHFGNRPVGGWENILHDMTLDAGNYAAFTLGRNLEGEVAEALRNIRRLGEVAAILVMKLYRCFEDKSGQFSEEDFLESLALIEDYLLRRAICGYQTRGYWSVFARIALKIRQENPLQSLKIALHMQPDNYSFPSNEEFREALLGGDLYRLQICRHLLERLENGGTNEVVDVSKLSIEHIMPQNENLREAWQEMLGPDWAHVQKNYLHKLGNLTLTGYNSKYSDLPFEDKKNMPEHGFICSPLRLNRWVGEQEKWTDQQMKTRGESLAMRALQVWRELEVEPKALSEARLLELEERVKGQDIKDVPMLPNAKQLFEVLRLQVLELGDVVELPEGKSISYHAPYFFLEVLPRTYYLTLLLSSDYNEIVGPSKIVQDASEWRFLVNSKHEGGVIAHIEKEEDIDTVMGFVEQAFRSQQG